MIYFDNAATTFPKPQEVIDATVDFMQHHAANPGRAGHRMSLESSRVIFETRMEIAQLINADNPMTIAFTKNATEALNIGIIGYAKKGDHIISTMMEHNSVSRPVAALEKNGISHTFAACDSQGFLDLEAFEASFKENTSLVCVTHASNVIGTVNDLYRIGEICKKRGAALLVDAAQTIGIFDIDVQKMNIAMLCAPGHKGLYGPMGTGFIYVREDIDLMPSMYGGTGSASESLVQPDIMPDKLEAGTVNAVGIAGLLAGVRFVKSIGTERIRKHEHDLLRLCIDELKKIDGITIYGAEDIEKRSAVIGFNIGSIPSTEIAYVLDSAFDIQVRSGLQCGSLAHRSLGTLDQGIIRVSFSYFNSKEEVEEFIESIKKINDEMKV